MATWHTDPCLILLRDQVDQAAPYRNKESDGTKGDEAHQGTDSAHNPDPADGNEVDALDLTHDPVNGADMAILTEALRKSKDDRLYLVIFNGQQFSSYSKNGIPPFTWRPYSGSNQHTRHAHVETNDKSHNETRLWKIGIDAMNPQQQSWTIAGSLADNPDTGKPYNVLHARLRFIQDATDPTVREMWQRAGWGAMPTYGLQQLGEMASTLIAGIQTLQAQVNTLTAKIDALEDLVEELTMPPAAEVDPASMKAVLLDAEVLSAQADAINGDFADRLSS
jgi:hypothetical protein